MTDQDILWREIYAALAWRLPRKDRTPQERLNRLAREHFPTLTQQLGDATCKVRRDQLSLHSIQELERWHDRADPEQRGAAIVVFRHAGRSVLIDGNNRVNLHLASGAQEPMSAVVIELAK